MKNLLKDKTYRLRGDISPLSYILKAGRSGTLLYFDEEKGFNRSIRHCPNEKSIFIDEQSDNAKVEIIEFERGYLTIPYKMVSTQEFLDKNPKNGVLYEEVNDEKEAKDDIVEEELLLDLKTAVREKLQEKDGVYELEALVAVLKGSSVIASELTESALKREVYLEINMNPHRFIDDNGNISLFDDSIKRKHIALTAIANGVLEISPKQDSYRWGHNKQTVLDIPKGIKPIECLSDHFLTDEGMMLLKEILKRN